MISSKMSKFNFATAIGNIYAQFVQVNRGLKSAYLIQQKRFKKVLPVCANDVIKKWKYHISAAIRKFYSK